VEAKATVSVLLKTIIKYAIIKGVPGTVNYYDYLIQQLSCGMEGCGISGVSTDAGPAMIDLRKLSFEALRNTLDSWENNGQPYKTLNK